MNYNEICRVYNNVNNDELVSQTAYEFEIYDDYYYQLFHHYSETTKGANQMIISITKRIKLPSGKYKKRVKYSSVKYQIEKVKPLRSHYKLSSLHAAKYHLVRDI